MNRQLQIERFLDEAHRIGVARLRADPSRIRDVADVLARWRQRAGPVRSDAYWDEWQALLDAGVDAIEMAACAPTDHAAALRSVSPMSVLISQQERAVLLAQSKATA